MQNTESMPKDEAILAYENEIRLAEAAKVNFVGNVEPLLSLQAEYANYDVFRAKLDVLHRTYPHFRRTRADGNCFFRGFLFAWLRHLLTCPRDEGARALANVTEWGPLMEAEGINRIVFEDAHEHLISLVRGATHGHISEANIVAEMRQEGTTQELVMLTRFITSCEIKRKADFYTPFIFGSHDHVESVEAFCNKSVMVMGEESDHIHIVALTTALQVPMAVIYLDGSLHMGIGGDPSVPVTHEFIPEECPGQAPVVHLLYRPGHYDVLYAQQ